MYQVSKDNISFYVNEESKAIEYAKDGYDVYLMEKLKLDGDSLVNDVDEKKIKSTVVSNVAARPVMKEIKRK